MGQTVPALEAEPQARREFASYFLDLQAAQRADGGSANKAVEWETFIRVGIEDGKYPASATKWRSPRSCKQVLQQS